MADRIDYNFHSFLRKLLSVLAQVTKLFQVQVKDFFPKQKRKMKLRLSNLTFFWIILLGGRDKVPYTL